MNLAEGFITHIVTRVLESHRADLNVIGKDIAKLEAVVGITSDNAVILSEAKNPRISLLLLSLPCLYPVRHPNSR